MSILHITEYAQMASDRVTHDVPAPQEPANRHQQVPISSKLAQSELFPSTTSFIRLFATAPCKVYFGNDPIEVEFYPIPANAEIFRGVYPKDCVWVIEDSE